jgi:hypothetical protein
MVSASVPAAAAQGRQPLPEAFLVKPPKNAITPEKADEARFSVQGAARSKRDSGDLEGAALHLSSEAARLKDPLLYVESGESYLEHARNERNIPTVDDAKHQALIALDMLHFLQSGDASEAWRPVSDGHLPGLISRAEAILSDGDVLIAEIEAEIEAANAPPPVEEKKRRPGLGLMIGGGVAVAVGAAGAGIGVAGLAIGSRSQSDVEDPLVYETEHRAAEASGAKGNLMAAVGLPLAAVGLGVGIALIVVGKKKRDAARGGDEEASVVVLPALSPSYSGLGLSARF